MKLKIRYILSLIFICLFAAEGFSQQTSQEKFIQGVTLFSSAKYQEAFQIWTEIYDTGYRSANLNYNIGNAYYKLNDIPNAILFYERAYLLNPADENINYNLQIARTLIVDRFQEIPVRLPRHALSVTRSRRRPHRRTVASIPRSRRKAR